MVLPVQPLLPLGQEIFARFDGAHIGEGFALVLRQRDGQGRAAAGPAHGGGIVARAIVVEHQRDAPARQLFRLDGGVVVGQASGARLCPRAAIVQRKGFVDAVGRAAAEKRD